MLRPGPRDAESGGADLVAVLSIVRSDPQVSAARAVGLQDAAARLRDGNTNPRVCTLRSSGPSWLAVRSAPPDTRTAQPDRASAAPDSATAQPDSATAASDMATPQPDSANAQPGLATTQPDSAAAPPDLGTAMPDLWMAPPVIRSAPPDIGPVRPEHRYGTGSRWTGATSR